jgi:uncharacterized protein YndB with AHSA1/START domain
VATEALYERELRVAASPETIFELLTDATAYPTWMGFGAEFEARAGGGFRIDFGTTHVSGSVLEVVPYQRVVVSWGWEHEAVPLAAGMSTVEFELVADDDETIVRLRHIGLSPALAAFHAWGWDRYLPRLAAVAEGRDPGPDPSTSGPAPELLALLGDAQQERESL